MAYIFDSSRLGFRNWKESDLPSLHTINSDQEVMAFFPSIKTENETFEFIKRMQSQYMEKGYCYFATVYKETDQVIGFIGLSYQTYESDFNPSVDIGWRLSKKFWGKGLATEGALACLAYGFNKIKLNEILSVAPASNVASINVMKKIGMSYEYDFKHPKLSQYPSIENCSLYTINNKSQNRKNTTNN